MNIILQICRTAKIKVVFMCKATYRCWLDVLAPAWLRSLHILGIVTLWLVANTQQHFKRSTRFGFVGLENADDMFSVRHNVEARESASIGECAICPHMGLPSRKSI